MSSARGSANVILLIALFTNIDMLGQVVDRTQAGLDAQAVAEFNDRVKAYVTLRAKVDDNAPKMQQTNDSAKIQAAQQSLAVLIRNARAGAKQGDIFTPAVEKAFRTLLRPEVKGVEGAKAKATIVDENPMVELKVNADYPAKEPLATVPPAVLQAMPVLPKDQALEYRFVRRHLLLLDTRANLIVDYLLNAIQ